MILRLKLALSLLVLLLWGCSAPSGPSNAAVGLRAEYFDGSDFSGLVYEQVQSELNFDWGQAAPVAGMRGGAFSARWTGWLEVPTAGEYTFYLSATGQAKLYLGDRLVLGEAGEAKLQLSAGSQNLRLEFVKTQTEAKLGLEWGSASLQRQTIARSSLRPSPTAAAAVQTVVAGQNLLVNPGFESGTGGWRWVSGSVFTTVAPGRDGGGRAAYERGYAWAQQDIPYSLIQVDSTYTLEAWGRALGSQSCAVGVMGGNSIGATLFRQELKFSGNWERKRLTQLIPKGTVWMLVYLFSGQTECLYDDAFVGIAQTTPPPPPPANGNLVVNGNFEQGSTAWQASGTASIVSPGRNSNRALQASNWGWVQQVLPFNQLTVGKTYQLTGWVRPSNGCTCWIGLLGGKGSTVLLNRWVSVQTSSTAWQEASLQQTIPSGLDWMLVWVQASAGNCQYDDISFTPVAPSVQAPTNPTNFKATASLSAVGLSWDASSGASSYSLERRSGSGAYSPLTSTAATTYTDTTVAASTDYTYRLKASNSGGSSSGVEFSVRTPDLPPPPPTAKTVHILYDSDSTQAARTFPSSLSRIGGVSSQAFSPAEAAQVYATLLANLLGRYPDLKVELKPVSSYTGLGADVSRVFYIGSYFDAPVPEPLLRDAAGGAPITWIGYNIWKLADRQAALGLNYRQVIAASTAADVDAGYNRVSYRGYDFQKLTRSAGNVVPTEIIDIESTKASNIVHAWATRPTGERIPYALQSGSFWYIADLPFSFAHELDRYVVFADLLGTMLGRNETCSPKAVIRLEDVQPLTNANDFKTALDILQRLQIPFGVATIPLHQDGLGNLTVSWTDRADILEQLRRVEGIGGRILQHGYTHQYKNLPNPSGFSATDWEFWNIAQNAPIAGMTDTEAVDRILAGKKILTDLGLKPAGWVTPHYSMPPAFYAKVNTTYDRFYERRLYQAGQTYQGQFFPYPVRDTTGALMVPENTNFVGDGRRPSDIIEVAKANRALRCPWVGTFFHPFLLSAPAAQGGVSAQEFEAMLVAIRNLGYTFVDVSSVGVGQ